MLEIRSIQLHPGAIKSLYHRKIGADSLRLKSIETFIERVRK